MIPQSGKRLRIAVVLAVVLTVALPSGPAPATGSPHPIAYLQGCCMASVIHTVQPDGTGLSQLGSYSTDWVFGPAWSPDGTTIAYSDSGEIWRMNADGTSRTRIAARLGATGWLNHPSWSPDGFSLVASRRGNRSQKGDLVVIRADGSEHTLITAGRADDESPEWAPDGSVILFTRHRSGATALRSIAPDGSASTRLFLSDGPITSPSWLPDMSGIIFERGGTIWMLDIVGGTPEELFPGSDPAPSPDGTQLAWIRHGDDIDELVVSDLDGQNATAVASCDLGCWLSDPDWA